MSDNGAHRVQSAQGRFPALAQRPSASPRRYAGWRAMSNPSLSVAEREQFAARVASCAPRLRLLFAHLTGARLRAHVELDDLVQETLLRALASARPPPLEELAPWLNALARHVAVDAARALRVRRRGAGALRLERADWSHVGLRESQVAAAGAGVLTRAADEDEHRRLMAAFVKLSNEHRRVIGLRQFEGLSAALVAQRMGRSESAVHSLYRRALEAWADAGR